MVRLISETYSEVAANPVLCSARATLSAPRGRSTRTGSSNTPAALIAALQAGQIAGAALDVLAQEPPAPDNPLLSMPNVLFTPHTAGVTRDTWARRGEFIFANLERVRRGDAPLAVIN